MLIRLCRGTLLQQKNIFSFGVEDYFSNKNMRSQQETLRKELEHMALKPTFTINDFKIRVQESLRSLDASFTSKLSVESKKKRREFEDDIKVLFCLFEDELNLNEVLSQKKQLYISQITRVPLQDVNMMFDRYLQGKMMHQYIRHLSAKNIEFPKTHTDLENGFLAYHQPKSKKNIKKYKTVKKYSRRQKARYAFGELKAPSYEK